MASDAVATDCNVAVADEPSLWSLKLPTPPRQCALGVSMTPDGSSEVTGEVTPGVARRLKRELEQSIFLRPEEMIDSDDEIEDCGLDAEDEDLVVEDHWDHVSKQVVQLQPGTSASMSPSCSMPEQAGDLDHPSVTVSDQAAQLRPGTSGDHESAKTSVEQMDAVPSGSGTIEAAPKRHAAGTDNEGSDLGSDFDDEYDLDEIVAARDPMRGIIPDDDELDVDVRSVVDSVEREMDAAIDRLVGQSSGFTWQKDFGTFGGVQETFSGPRPGPVKDYDTPYEAFCDIWDEGIIELIVRETNKYAHQTINALRGQGKLKSGSRLHQWLDTDADEILVLFAMYILMGIAKNSSQHEYWITTGLLQLPYFRSLMSYNRYILLNKFLHFADNSDVSQNLPQVGGKVISAKLRKIAPLIAHLNSKFESLYNLQQDVAIDESLTLFKDNLSWVQAIKSKAARIGVKSFELCESRSGYLYRFELYTGKNSERNDAASPIADLAGKSTQVVIDLLKGLENLGHCVTMENYYNSPALARHLKTLGFDCLGTLRANRKNVPEQIVKAPKQLEKGKIIALHSGDVSCISWQDNKMVNMISTYHIPETIVGRRAGKELVKPCIVQDYNNTMGGVDLKDQKLSMYLLERKRCLKWYMKIFKRLLNVSVLNAFIMYSESRKRRNLPLMTHRDFRAVLSGSLVDKHRSSPSDVAVPIVQSEVRLQKDIVHAPKYGIAACKRRCRVCYRKGIRKDVRSQCVTCDAFICFGPCWMEWHSLKKLPGDTRVKRRRK